MTPLFDSESLPPSHERLEEGAVLLRGFATSEAPGGYTMSVAMTNCGRVVSLVQFTLDCGAEEIFVEPVNARGPGLALTEQALRVSGFKAEADQIAVIRHRIGWSAYARRLLEQVQSSLADRPALSKLRFLLYPTKLTVEDELWFRQHCHGVKWLKSTSETGMEGSKR
jgi:hypothetical protein